MTGISDPLTGLVATVLTVYGIETLLELLVRKLGESPLQQYLPFTVLKHHQFNTFAIFFLLLQQYLPFTVCDEGCETAEKRSDDEVRTSLVPDCKDGKTKAMM